MNVNRKTPEGQAKLLNQGKALKFLCHDWLPEPEYLVWKQNPQSSIRDANPYWVQPNNSHEFFFVQWVPEVKGCPPWHGKSAAWRKPPQPSLIHAENLENLPCYLWWPWDAMNIKVASSWFNLGNAFLDMVFKHFGNECAHNELAWTLCFLSRLSSWASPSGLAKVQKQTLNSYVSVSLLTFTAITSDSLSCLHFLKISSSREMTCPCLPCAHPLKREVPYQRFSPKQALTFMTETLQRGIKCFWKNFEHLSAVTKRWLVTKSPWEYNGKETNETSFKCLKEKRKKKRFAPDSSQGRCTMVLSYFLGGNKQEEEKPETSLSKSTFPLSVFNLWTSEGILMASYFLPHPQ